jgi:hypothetical protein
MKTLFEKMRANRSRAILVAQRKWIDDARAKVESDRARHENRLRRQKIEHEKQLEDLRAQIVRLYAPIPV